MSPQFLNTLLAILATNTAAPSSGGAGALLVGSAPILAGNAPVVASSS